EPAAPKLCALLEVVRRELVHDDRVWRLRFDRHDVALGRLGKLGRPEPMRVPRKLRMVAELSRIPFEPARVSIPCALEVRHSSPSEAVRRLFARTASDRPLEHPLPVALKQIERIGPLVKGASHAVNVELLRFGDDLRISRLRRLKISPLLSAPLARVDDELFGVARMQHVNRATDAEVMLVFAGGGKS